MGDNPPEALSFRRLRHEDLPEALAWQLFTAARVIFHEFFAEIRDWSEITKGFDGVEHLVLLDGELLVSHLALIHTRVRWNETEARVLGVAGVMTLPSYRERGLVPWLFRLVNEDLKEGGADFGLLFCDPEMNRYYAKQGWSAFPGKTTFGDPQSPRLLNPKEDQARWRAVEGGKRPKRLTPVYVGQYLW